MSYILRYWKLGLQYILWEGGEDTIQSIMITNSDSNMLYIPVSLNLIITIILPYLKSENLSLQVPCPRLQSW